MIKLNKNIIIVVHKLHTNPDDDLVIYLNNLKINNLLHIKHSFSDAKDRRSYYVWYKDGQIYKKEQSSDYKKLPEFAIYLKEFFFTRRWIKKSGLKWNKYIGMDGLCSNFGLLFKNKYVEKVICWNLDFVPSNRFSSKIKNFIYRKININAFKKSDEMWNHTPKMVNEKEKILGLQLNDYAVHRIVPLGTWNDRIKKYNYFQSESHTAVFLGHLIEKQGIQLVIEAIPRIIKKVPDFKLKIIGDGVYKTKLELLVNNLKVDEYVDFLGSIESDIEAENIISKCSIGLAPYIRKLDTFTKFGADPGKIKTYLACGLPVLITDLPWNAKDIEKCQCGVIIKEDLEDISSKIIKFLLDGQYNQTYRDNAIHYAEKFNYHTIFNNLNL